MGRLHVKCVLTPCDCVPWRSPGNVHCVDERGQSSSLLSVEGSIQKLFYLERRDVLGVVTETLMLSQYTLGPEGGAQELMKVLLHCRHEFFIRLCE